MLLACSSIWTRPHANGVRSIDDIDMPDAVLNARPMRLLLDLYADSVGSVFLCYRVLVTGMLILTAELRWPPKPVQVSR